MPISIVVGGQYGSEGKGKVAYWLAQRQKAAYAIRVGGPNSGHTVVDRGARSVLRHLPTPVLLKEVVGVVPAGAYLDLSVLLREVKETGVSRDRLLIHPAAVIIDESMRQAETNEGLVERISSTGQGVGGAVAQRAMRRESLRFAQGEEALKPFVNANIDSILSSALDRGERVLIEGTQGFGLSIYHGTYPYTTSRDTTAAGALSEAGLSPRDVDCIALVLRAFPIRVSGASGPMPREITWQEIQRRSRANVELTECTTVTGRPRRVAEFDEDVVLRAIQANQPHLIVLNHVDYFDYANHAGVEVSEPAGQAVFDLEMRLQVDIDLVGLAPGVLVERPAGGWNAQKGSARMTSARKNSRRRKVK